MKTTRISAGPPDEAGQAQVQRVVISDRDIAARMHDLAEAVFLGLDAIGADGGLDGSVPPDAQIAVILDEPCRAVARRLAEGQPPAPAAQDIERYMRRVAELLRRNRRRATVFLHDDVAARPEIFAEALLRRRRLPAALPASGRAEAFGGEACQDEDRIALLIAACAIRATADLPRLIQEVNASMLRLNGDAPADSAADPYPCPDWNWDRIDLLFRAWTDLHARIASLTGEAERWRRLAERQAQTLDRTDCARDEADALHAAYRPLLNRQLEAARDEIAERTVESSRLAAERDSARAERDALERDIAELRASTSWRVTAPLRWLGQSFPRMRRLGRLIRRPD